MTKNAECVILDIDIIWEAIVILGKNIKQDLQNMPRKSLDISLIADEKSDLTFFDIEEEETNETLKALKQTYVTTNYKEETILNLQNQINNNSETTSKELKLESYKRYNSALDLANKNYITSAVRIVESALELNPKDIEILNLKGLLKLLKCDFSKAFESFYTGLCYGNNDLSRKYVDILSKEDFKTFLSRYNHSIRFINEDLNHESIQILDNMIEEDPDLIEPYVILALLYDKLGNVKKREAYLDRLKDIDVDNEIFEREISQDKEDKQLKESSKNTKRPKKKNIVLYAIIGCLVVGLAVYYTQNKIQNLNSQLTNKEEKLDQVGKELNEKSQTLTKANKQLEKTSKELKQTSKELDKASNDDNTSDEITLYNQGMDLKKSGDYDAALKKFELVRTTGKTKQYISEAIHELAITNEKSGNKEEAIRYYEKYLNIYTPQEKYYDDTLYQLGLLYYNMGDIDSAKQTFYGLRSEVPDSVYNNSKVNEILSE